MLRCKAQSIGSRGQGKSSGNLAKCKPVLERPPIPITLGAGRLNLMSDFGSRLYENAAAALTEHS
jgi:hypothetical protein